MYYLSTRGSKLAVVSAEAVKMGIAPDGGLFVPEYIPEIELEDIALLADEDYCGRAKKILALFMDDYTPEELEECVGRAYSPERFEKKDIAPLIQLTESLHVLELWHGPTCAFKDMALQILPHLMVNAVRKTGETEEIVILVATSGDTGKAALEGFRDVDGTTVIVFYPEKGVSEVQKMQMVTQLGANVHAVAVRGNFDDTQTGVKNIFGDAQINSRLYDAGYKFSSANSINWGRLAPQIVYYFSAYADLLKENKILPGEKINFVVPTGNFGNILAAYYACKMGLPVNKLICASNDNNVLTDFFHTGTYDKKREFKKTLSPSMDILISSNLERLLFELCEHNDEIVASLMNKLQNDGEYTVDEDVQLKTSEIFWADWSDQNETINAIERVYDEFGYVIDTHTAVAMDVYEKYTQETGDSSKTVVISTASAFKFNESVVKAIFGDEEAEGKTEFQMLEILSEKCGIPIPKGLADLESKEILHKTVCEKADMSAEVLKILGI